MKTEASRLVPLTRCRLLSLRFRAIRRGKWFRVLNRVERGLIDLAIQIVEKVRSPLLARSVIFVVKKLLSAMESDTACQTKAIGFSLAHKLSRIAQNWGNKSASDWALDSDFARFLAICHMNTFPMPKGNTHR